MITTKICCFTGHRDIPAEYIVRLPELLDRQLYELTERGFSVFRAGGAIGFDTLCALKVLEIKKNNPHISLELCLPCTDQTEGWNDREKHIYNYILERADNIRYAHKYYVSGCMFDRNRMLVDGADLCLAYLSSSKGGTAYTCSYAKKKGVEVINTFDLLK